MAARKARRFREPTATAAIDRWYRKKLRQLAKVVAQIGSEYAAEENPLIAADRIQGRLFSYADTLDQWASEVAATMLERVALADFKVWKDMGRKAWEETGQRVGAATLKALRSDAVAPTFSKLQLEQVELIKSLPREAGLKVHEWATEGLARGQRYADIVGRIQDELGRVTESRAVLIARTETARARSNFTQARARAIGSTQYVWHTVGDGTVRPMHAALDGTVHDWSNPPVTDIGRGGIPIRSNPGCVFNCRCFAEPLFPKDIFE